MMAIPACLKEGRSEKMRSVFAHVLLLSPCSLCVRMVVKCERELVVMSE